VTRLYAILGVIAVLAVVAYSSMFVINEREQGIVLRFGEIRSVVREPGLYFKVPGIETVQIIEQRLLSFEIQDMRVQVRDGRRYLVDAFVAFRIVDPREFRENVGGILSLAIDNMRTRLDAALRRVYGQRAFEAALSEERAEMMRDVRDQLRPLARELGIEIVDVRIRRTDLLPEVMAQTFERMKAERLAEAAEIRARGTEQALRIRAEADRDVVTIVAEATRDAEILRGEGDAERNRIFADAFQRDEEFFEFYRSMTAYERALNQDRAMLVLSPDSEFFRFFRESDGIVAARVDEPPAAVPGVTSGLPQAGEGEAESIVVLPQDDAPAGASRAEEAAGGEAPVGGRTAAERPVGDLPALQ
jgi:modulator of FtsH protease HflC